jgi:hypothetical protein
MARSSLLSSSGDAVAGVLPVERSGAAIRAIISQIVGWCRPFRFARRVRLGQDGERGGRRQCNAAGGATLEAATSPSASAIVTVSMAGPTRSYEVNPAPSALVRAASTNR